MLGDFLAGRRRRSQDGDPSLTAWQVGMHGFTALAHFLVFRRVIGVAPRDDTVGFWFTTQIAMVCCFLTAYPLTWWLIGIVIKEKM